MSRTVCSIVAMIVLFLDVAGCGSQSTSAAPAVDPLRIEAIGVSSIGGLGDPSYALLVADDSCAYFVGGNQPPGSHFVDQGPYVGMGSDLSYLKYLLSKNNLLSAPPGGSQREWAKDEGTEILEIFYKGDDEPRFVYSHPDDPPQARMVARMVDGIAFRTYWVPYSSPASRQHIAAARAQILKSCPWPSKMHALVLPKPTPTVRP